MDATRIRPRTEQTETDEQPLSLNHSRHPRLDQCLAGRYRVEALVASGGMNDVYRAVDEHLERAGSNDCQVAVKILRQSLTHDPDAVSMLAREAARSMRLAHPGIIRVKDLEQDGDTWFIVMELLEGEPLSRLIQRHRPRGLPWKGCRWIIRQVLETLRYAHGQGIVHADLKPSNVFLTHDGQVKLLDFGVARALRSQQQVEDYLAPRQKDETRMFGYTPAYASPSLRAGNESRPHDDLYALACIAYELVSSRHPFERRELTDAERASYPLKRPKHLPWRVWRVIRPLLRQNQPQPSTERWEKALAPRQWRIPAAAAIGGLLTSLTLAGAQAGLDMSHDTAPSLKNKLDGLDLLSQGATPRQIITALPALSDLERGAILRHREPLLSKHYISRLTEATRALQKGKLAPVPKALTLAQQAQRYYPNHSAISKARNQFQQRRVSLADALREQWQQKLAATRFKEADTLAMLTKRHNQLSLLGEQPPAPEAEVRSAYSTALQDAMTDSDTGALRNLVALGDLAFGHDSDIGPALAWARVQAGFSVTSASGNSVEHKLMRLEKAVAGAETVAELNAVFETLQELPQASTDHAAKLESLQQALANRYMQQARQRLGEQRLESAGPLLERATDLTRRAQASP
ncbi:serine/threonine-protein kinase [Salicola sp. Rm-C-2C1-2]|uniref:serine/threonine-protein kinase n=1 Tax=Salicola sp. Rm-C-2C1-2 TaxID=3141321 RepID=UPI0032E501B8